MTKSTDQTTIFRDRKPPVSPQAMAVLQLLAASGRPLSAKQVASSLQVRPQAAHRSLSALQNLGLVHSFTIVPGVTQPAFYQCQTLQQTKRSYLQRMEKDAQKEFDSYFAETLRTSHANRLYNQ